MNSDSVYLLTQRIAREPSRLGKTVLAKQIPVRYLQEAYHPHYMYGFTKTGPIKMFEGRGRGQIDDSGWALLSLLRRVKAVSKREMLFVSKYIRRLSPLSAKMFKNIILKDFRCGIAVKTINELYPGLIPDEFCMKGEDYDPRHISGSVWGSPKVDGLRGFFRDGALYTGSGRLHRGLDHIIAELRLRNVTQPIDGELVVPGMDFDTSSGKIRSNRPTPNARFLMFEAPDYPSPLFGKRYQFLQMKFKGCLYLHVLPHTPLDTIAEIDAYTELLLENRNFMVGSKAVPLDGAMFKKVEYTYQYSRSTAWLKRKPFDTKDVRVLGVYPGKGKYEGMAGGLQCRLGSKEINAGMGLSDKQREDWFNDPSLIVGKIVEVGYMEKSSDGRLRHPQLLRVRYDKE